MLIKCILPEHRVQLSYQSSASAMNRRADVCVYFIIRITILRGEALCVMLGLARVALKEQIGLVLQYVSPLLHPDERLQTNWIGGV